MNPRVERFGIIFRAIVHECKVERITFMAGSIAYNAFVSLLPLLFLLLAVVSAFGSGELESNMLTLTQSIVTPGAGEVLVDELRHASVGASALGLAALVWGMLRIFRSLDMAFSNIYETQEKNTLPNQIKDGTIVFLSIAAVIVGVVALESLISLRAASGPAWFGQRLLLICIVALALIPMYYLFPDESGMSVAETLPGVFFTATTLVIFQSVFSIYVAFSSQTAENSMLASILIFLTWLYFSGLVILLGVVINAVLSNRSEDVNIEPVIGGVPKVTFDDETNIKNVPDDSLHQVNHRIGDQPTFRIAFDDDEDIVLRAPDLVTVDTDTSPIPGLNDTASIEFKWVQDKGIRKSPDDS